MRFDLPAPRRTPTWEELVVWPLPDYTPLPHNDLSKEERHAFQTIQRRYRTKSAGKKHGGPRVDRP